MTLLTAPTKTEQVAAMMRSAIKNGEYPPHSRLKSVRELADGYGVSSRIISSVLDILEQEKLVKREPRRGIFVEQLASTDEIDVYFLLWGAGEVSCNYDDEILKIMSPQVMPEGFNFLTRTVRKNSLEFDHLDHELHKINNMPNIKCLLVFARLFGPEEIKKFEDVHCPVVFIGDSARCSLDSLNVNHLNFSDSSCRVAVDFLIEQGHRQITLFTGPQKTYFYRRYRDIVKDICDKNDVGLDFVEMPPIDCGRSDELISELYRPTLESAKEAYENPCIMYGVEDKVIVKTFSEIGATRPDLPIVVPIVDSKYLGEFYKSTFRLIRDVVQNPGTRQKVLCDVSYVLEDLNDGSRYSFDGDQTIKAG